MDRSRGLASGYRYLLGQRNDEFLLEVSIDDSSVYATTEAASTSTVQSDLPVMRTFRSRNNRVRLKDGQTRQLTTAVDRISGEMVRVDVTLTVVK